MTMRSQIRTRRLVIAVAAVGALAVSCSSDPGVAPPPNSSAETNTAATNTAATNTGVTNGPATTTPAGTVEPTSSDVATTETDVPVASGYSIAALLGSMPEVKDRNNFQLTTGSFNLAAEQAGMVRPAESAPENEQKDFLVRLTGIGKPGEVIVSCQVPVMQMQSLMISLGSEFKETIGWSVTQLDTFMSDTVAPEVFTVMTGDFDTAAIDTAFGGKTDGIWAQPGDDLKIDFKKRGIVEDLGRPIRMGEKGSQIGIGLTTPAMKAWVNGEGKTMADDAGAMAIATALDEAGVYSATILRTGFERLPFDVTSTSAPTTLPDVDLPTIFDTAGLGLKVVDGQPVVVIVYHHPDEKTATDNISAMQAVAQSGVLARGQKFSEFLELTDVVAQGNISVATFTLAEDKTPLFVWGMPFTRDLPFIHG